MVEVRFSLVVVSIEIAAQPPTLLDSNCTLHIYAVGRGENRVRTR